MIPKAEQKRLERRQQNAKCYGYCRVSRAVQEHGDSIESQKHRIANYHRIHFGDDVPLADYFIDIGKSAYKIDLAKRPAAKQMLQAVRAGDHVIIDRVDRMCRSVRDASNVLQWFKSRMIHVHFLDIRYNSADPHSELLLHQLAIFAQLDSTIKSARINEAFEVQRRHGRHVYAMGDLGTEKAYRCCGIRRFDQPDGKEILYKIVWLEYAPVVYLVAEREKKGKRSYRTLSDIVEQWLCKRKGTIFSKSAFVPRTYSPMVCRVRIQQYHRHIAPIIESLGHPLYPPAPNRQEKEIDLARAWLNSDGEIERWEMAYPDEGHENLFKLFSL